MNTILNKLKIVTLLIFVCSVSIYAQNELFETNIYDFGDINVKDKSVTHTFKFANNTNQPVVINSAYARCSCIEAIWSKEPIAVGDSGYVSVRYHIISSGTFNKKIRVSTNVGTQYLNVKGKAVRTK